MSSILGLQVRGIPGMHVLMWIAMENSPMAVLCSAMHALSCGLRESLLVLLVTFLHLYADYRGKQFCGILLHCYNVILVPLHALLQYHVILAQVSCYNIILVLVHCYNAMLHCSQCLATMLNWCQCLATMFYCSQCIATMHALSCGCCWPVLLLASTRSYC